MPLSQATKKSLKDFIKKNNTAAPDVYVQSMQDHQAINFEIKMSSTDSDKKYKYKGPVLSELIKQGYYSLAVSVIAEGADVNSLDSDGYKPLYYAIAKDNMDLITMLVGYDAETDKVPFYTNSENGDDLVHTWDVPGNISINKIISGNKIQLQHVAAMNSDVANFLAEFVGR